VATAVAVAVAGSAIAASARRDTDRPDFLAVDDGQVIETPVVTAAPNSTGADLGTVILTGDSIAASFQDAAMREAGRRGIGFASATRPGCGLIGGLPLRDDGIPFAWSSACEEGLPVLFDELILSRAPTTVVWLSSWESSRRLVDAVTYVPGTLRFDWMVYRLIDDSVAHLTRDGAKVVFVTVGGRAIPNEDDYVGGEIDRLIGRLNMVLRTYAYDHPDTTMVMDLADILCPAGSPCPATVDDVVPRPRDGTHFEGDGPEWMAATLFDWLENLRLVLIGAIILFIVKADLR
jgi:hypothetical protein